MRLKAILRWPSDTVTREQLICKTRTPPQGPFSHPHSRTKVPPAANTQLPHIQEQNALNRRTSNRRHPSRTLLFT
eukprot:142405-Prorocentrum_minimum.AAC.1